MSTRDLEQELAHELRGVLRQFKIAETDDAALRDAIGQVKTLRDLLGARPRPRWFDAIGESGRPADVDLNYNDYSLYSGRSSPAAAPLTVRVVDLADGRRAIEGRVTCNQLYEGPPHGVHGGYVAGLFDDVLGGTIRLVEGPSAVTGTLEVKYRKITPLDTELRFLAWVHHESGRRIHSRATCHAGDVLTAEAEALFIRVDMQALGMRIPPVDG